MVENADFRGFKLALNSKVRIQLKGDLTDWLARATAGTREAPVTQEITLIARQLPLHQDPADGILVATALALDLTLVSADTRLRGLGILKTLANR